MSRCSSDDRWRETSTMGSWERPSVKGPSRSSNRAHQPDQAVRGPDGRRRPEFHDGRRGDRGVTRAERSQEDRDGRGSSDYRPRVPGGPSQARGACSQGAGPVPARTPRPEETATALVSSPGTSGSLPSASSRSRAHRPSASRRSRRVSLEDLFLRLTGAEWPERGPRAKPRPRGGPRRRASGRPPPRAMEAAEGDVVRIGREARTRGRLREGSEYCHTVLDEQ